jgi:hypothetical protein
LQTVEAEARRIINALKTGVIPDADLDLLCVGRERMLKEFKRCLDLVEEGGSCVKFISGEYGSGKSFMLGKARQLALKRGFAVSRVQISRNSHLNNPDVFYYGIMHNLDAGSACKSGSGFEELFNLWLERLKSNPSREAASREIRDAVSSLNSYNSAFARAFLTYVRSRIAQDGELSDAAAAWIKGEKNLPAAVKARFDVKGDIDKSTSMDFLRAFIHLLRLIGYNGLVILVDELELVMSLRADIRKGCYENLRYIIDTCGGNGFGSCMFVFAGTAAVFEDPEKGIKTYQALDQRLGEAGPKSNPGMPDMRQTVLKLEKLGNEELQNLTGRIIHLHRTAYGWEPRLSVEAARNWTLLTLGKEKGTGQPINTREFIIKLVEILDILEQNPGYNLYNTELKMLNRNGVDMFVNVLPKKRDP